MLPVSAFLDFIEKNALFSKADKILLAVSGGMDSVLMTHLFKLAGFRFSIAHCNFNLRAEESQRDEAFVRLLAADMDVSFYVNHFDTKKYAHEQQLSTQMAARALRYAWFEEVRETAGYAYVAVAQHQNDSVETVLLNLMRGTGIRGLHGILPKRDNIVRPLLFLNRDEIEQYAREAGLAYVEDSSNLQDVYARNRLRHQVIPILKELNPLLEDTFTQNIKRFSEIEFLLEKTVVEKRKEFNPGSGPVYRFALQKIRELYPQSLLFYELMRPYRFSPAVADEILRSLDKQSGTTFYSSNHQAQIDRDYLVVQAKQVDDQLVTTSVLLHPQDGEIMINGRRLTFTTSYDITFTPDKIRAYVDFERLIFPLVIRYWQEGDKFMPLGMSQFKKLSDFFIAEKIPLYRKATIPILINGNGEIIWVMGLRADNRYKVSSDTKKVAIFEYPNE